MCTWFYAEKSTLSPIITKAQRLPLADTIRNTVTFSGNVGQYPSDRYASGIRSEQARQYGGVPDDMGLHGRAIIKTAYQLPYRNSGPEACMERLLVQAEMRDPSRIAKNALTNMVMEKAIDYPESKPAFMQI